MRALAVTASNRASAGVYEDRGGPLIVTALTELGFDVDGPRVVPDGSRWSGSCARPSPPGTRW